MLRADPIECALALARTDRAANGNDIGNPDLAKHPIATIDGQIQRAEK